MDELLLEFVGETRETLEALAEHLVAWERDPLDRVRLDAIFRFFHTVKGSAGFLNLPRFEALAHAAEEVLAALRETGRRPEPREVDAILDLVDRIAELTSALESGESIDQVADDKLIHALAEAGTGGEPVGWTREAEPDPAPDVQAPDGCRADGDDPPDAEPGRAEHVDVPTPRTIRVPLTLIDRMMNGVSDLVLARNELARQLRDVQAGGRIHGAFERLSGSLADLRDAVSLTRMQRVDRLFAPVPRMLRELRTELGKSVELVTVGGEVELDREMIEMMRDPMLHIIRNAVDHGIETPEERLARGKPAHGTIRLEARQSGNQIVIVISDDGKGIDIDRLTAKAIAARVRPATEIQAMPEEARLQLVFAPGLSTAASVSSVSGRGVGMDVVRSNVERVGGTIELQNRPGAGLTIMLRVPLTLTIMACLIIEQGDSRFALPQSAVREIMRLTNPQVRLESPGGGALAFVRDDPLPVVDLSERLGLERAASPARTLISVALGGGETYALLVDAVIDHEDLVVRPGAPLVMGNGIYAGTTLPDNGRPMLLIDPAGLTVEAGARAKAREAAALRAQAHGQQQAQDQAQTLLRFTDCHGRSLAVATEPIQRVEEVGRDRVVETSEGFRFIAGERTWPVVGLPAGRTDSSVRLLALSDGESCVYLAIDEVDDIVTSRNEVEPAAVPGFVAGTVLIDGGPVELVDVHWLFAQAAGGGRAALARRRPRCGVTGEADPWNRLILVPLLRAAGYDTILSDEPDPSACDFLLVSESDPISLAAAIPAIRLRTREIARAGDGSVFRYDREGLMRALAMVSQQIEEQRA